MDITKMGLRRLKFRYGESNGKDREAEQELRRRGFNWRELREVVWEYGGIKWGLAKSRANEIAICRKNRVRNQKKQAAPRAAKGASSSGATRRDRQSEGGIRGHRRTLRPLGM